MTPSEDLTRRDFLKDSLAVGTVLGGMSLVPVWGQDTPETISVALVGCGGRGSADLGNCIEAGKLLGIQVQVVALADVQAGRLRRASERFGVPPEQCFGGFDGYQKVLASDADLVLLVTSPNFRPTHFKAAIEAGKHVFVEKPIAVDPPGVRDFIATGTVAAKKERSVGVGTQRRHDGRYQRNQHAVANGAIGPIRGGTVSWCGGKLWFRTRDEGEDDASYLVRNWVSFTEMSGDHIVEQHVHNIDVANWFIGRVPVSAVGFGGRARRETGNQFDFFSVDFDYGEDCHIHSMCRQINGCYSRVNEFLTGTTGSVWPDGKLNAAQGNTIETPDFGILSDNNGVQEFVDLLKGIREGKPMNRSRDVAEATMVAMMGRISAYTGKLVRMRDLMENTDSPFYNLALSPTAQDFEAGNVTAPPDAMPAIPGEA